MRSSLYISIAAVWLLACTSPQGGPSSIGPSVLPPTTGASELRAGEPPDMSGSWNWGNVELLRMPPAVAMMVSVTPEGPNTQARCESSGTMTLVQSGSTFSGTASRASNDCRTTGGQTFRQPGLELEVVDGHFRGGTVRFSFNSSVVKPCPHTATVTTDQGMAIALSGSGHCVLPGHPRSESPLALDPPPGGTSVTLSWEAVRP